MIWGWAEFRKDCQDSFPACCTPRWFSTNSTCGMELPDRSLGSYAISKKVRTWTLLTSLLHASHSRKPFMKTSIQKKSKSTCLYIISKDIVYVGVFWNYLIYNYWAPKMDLSTRILLQLRQLNLQNRSFLQLCLSFNWWRVVSLQSKMFGSNDFTWEELELEPYQGFLPTISFKQKLENALVNRTVIWLRWFGIWMDLRRDDGSDFFPWDDNTLCFIS